MLAIAPASRADAYSYNHTFKPPFEGCAKKEDAQKVTQKPYVNPKVNATNTTYCLLARKELVVASSFVKTGSTGRNSFTYKSGYGGKGTELRLDYFPTQHKFSMYNVYGAWQP